MIGAEPGRSRPSAEEIAWVGLWPAAALLLVGVLWLAHPLSELYPQPTPHLYAPFQAEAKPEPLEATRVLIALLIPIALAGLVLMGGPGAARRRFDGGLIAFEIAALALVVWGVLAQESGPYLGLPPDYFDSLLLSVPVLAVGLVLGLALTALGLAGAFPFDRLGRPDRRRWRWAIVLVAVLLTVLWLSPAILTDRLLADSGVIPSGHTLFQGEDYFAVVNGLTPMVDYVSQYANVLPYVVAPALDVFGLSTTSLTISMVALSAIALLAVYGVFREVTRRHWVALTLYVPYLALSLFPWDQPGLSREFNGSYFGVLPSRYLGPFVVAWLTARAIGHGRTRVGLLCFAAGLTALNNAEFGVPCALALLVALFLGGDRLTPFGARARLIVLQAVAGFGAAIVVVSAFVLVRTGELPDFGLLTYYSKVFAEQGFGLEPMPTLGLHIAVYLTYVAALLLAAVRYASAARDRATTAMLAYSAIFGLLTTEYFAGRSLPWQLMLLFPAWGLTLGLLTWNVALRLPSMRADPLRLRRTILPSLAVMVGFGVMVAAIVTIPLPWRQVERLSQDGTPLTDLSRAEAFVETATHSGEPILLIGTGADHRVADAAGVADVSPWNGAVSMFSSREFTRAMDALDERHGSTVILEPSFFIPPDSPASTQDPAVDTQTPDRILRARGFVQRTNEPPFELWQRATVGER
jgi:hypothetical protein